MEIYDNLRSYSFSMEILTQVVSVALKTSGWHFSEYSVCVSGSYGEVSESASLWRQVWLVYSVCLQKIVI